MKTKILLSILLFVGLTVSSQVRFAYDGTGNRIKREIVIQRQNMPDQQAGTIFTEIISEKTIFIYPNPTQGILKIEISDYEYTDICELSIFSLSGQQVFSGTTTSSTTDIDISGQPNGIYIMHIVLNGIESTWKIIKK